MKRFLSLTKILHYDSLLGQFDKDSSWWVSIKVESSCSSAQNLDVWVFSWLSETKQCVPLLSLIINLWLLRHSWWKPMTRWLWCFWSTWLHSPSQSSSSKNPNDKYLRNQWVVDERHNDGDHHFIQTSLVTRMENHGMDEQMSGETVVLMFVCNFICSIDSAY